jgi:predicted enzyme related to lactoylglutathione lyase/uncharacterized protein YciI
MRIIALLCAVAMLAASRAWAGDAPAPASVHDANSYYAVMLHLDEDADKQAAAQALEGHIQHLIELYDQGALVLAGPFMETGVDGLAVVNAASAAEARGFFETDPSVQAGYMHIVEVHQWWVPMSRPDNRRMTMDEFHAMMASQPPAEGGGSAGDSAPVPSAVGDGMDAEEDAVEGALVHFELPSTDFAQTQAFYGQVFGWTFQSMGDAYMLYQTPGGDGGGFTKDYAPGPGGGLFYIYTDDVAAKLREVAAAGGKIVLAAFGVPGYGWVGLFEDPQGNKVGLFSGKNPPPLDVPPASAPSQ